MKASRLSIRTAMCKMLLRNGLFAAFVASSAIALPQTRFSVLRDGDVWWLANPARERFLSMGVCCVGLGNKPEEWKATNPGYSGLKLFPNVPAWSRSTQKNLKSWGFNTVGSWSEHEALRGDLYQTPVLHLITTGIPWRDMWDPKIVEETYKFAEKQISQWRGDSRIIGYFSDNELGWWYGAMFEWAWKAVPEHGTRKRLVDLLRRDYGSDWTKVAKDFDAEGATDFASLEKEGRLFLKPGGNGMAYVRHVMSMLAKRYYELSRDAIRKADPGALYMGDRYISNYYPEVAIEAGKVADVVSTNLNATWADGGLYRYYLDDLYRLAKKPIMITEFYQCAMENASGNMNDASGFPTVKTQRERNAGADRQVSEMISKPYVVGAHWFQFYDENTHGRGDGENYNMGLVDINGKAYGGLVDVFRRLDAPKVHGGGLRVREPGADRASTLPSVEPLKARDLLTWPRDRAYIPHLPGDARGDLYMAWHPSGLFVGLAWDEDHFTEAFYRDGRIPAEDRARLTLKFKGVKYPITAVIGPGGDMELAGANSVFHKAAVRSTAIFRVPTNAFGKAQLKKGEQVEFEAELQTRGRTYRMSWKGQRTLQ